MIDTTDDKIVSWVKSVLGDAVSVTLGLPPSEATGSGVGAYLLEVAPEPLTRSARKPEPFRLTLRYLITTWSEDPAEAHRIFGELMFAALGSVEMEVESAPLEPAWWRALGIPPRPAMRLRVPLLKPRTEPRVPRVRTTVVTSSPMRPLIGQVRGPGDVGITGAVVEVPALRLSTRTDNAGSFYFPAVPAQPPIRRLRLRVQGRAIEVVPSSSEAGGEPLIIQLSEDQL